MNKFRLFFSVFVCSVFIYGHTTYASQDNLFRIKDVCKKDIKLLLEQLRVTEKQFKKNKLVWNETAMTPPKGPHESWTLDDKTALGRLGLSYLSLSISDSKLMDIWFKRKYVKPVTINKEYELNLATAGLKPIEVQQSKNVYHPYVLNAMGGRIEISSHGTFYMCYNFKQ